MTELVVHLDRDIDDHLQTMCGHLKIPVEDLLVRIVRRLVEVDELWLATGLPGIQPPEVPPLAEAGKLGQVDHAVPAGEDLLVRFSRICSRIGTSGQGLLGMMARGLAEEDLRTIENGHVSMAAHVTPGHEESMIKSVADTAVYTVTGDIRPGSGLVWPADKPFPWTDAECAALVRGHMVRWRGSMKDFTEHLPGQYEMYDGSAIPYQS